MHTHLRVSAIAAIIALPLALLAVMHKPPHTAFADPAGTLSGYAWSDMPDGSDETLTSDPSSGRGAGWISFSCQNESVCDSSNYGVVLDASGVLSGYAWSGNIGWISFNASDLAGCPESPCQASIDQTTGAVSGWARALAATNGSGGWDGWIHFSGANYGVTVVDCAWGGYAWGGDIMGWIHFAGPTYGVTGTGTACATPLPPPNPCPLTGQSCVSTPNGCGMTDGTYQCVNNTDTCVPPANLACPAPDAQITAVPQIVSAGGNAVLTWSSENMSSCKVTGTDGFATSSLNALNEVDPNPISQTTVFTLACQAIQDGQTHTYTTTVRVKPSFSEF